MNTVLESAFLAPLAELEGLETGVVFETGASSDTNEADATIVTVSSDDAEHVVGPLWKAAIKITLEQPAFTKDRDTFEQRAEAIRGWVEDGAAVNAVTATGLRIAGHKLTKSLITFLEGKWVAHFEMIVGVDTAV